MATTLNDQPQTPEEIEAALAVAETKARELADAVTDEEALVLASRRTPEMTNEVVDEVLLRLQAKDLVKIQVNAHGQRLWWLSMLGLRVLALAAEQGKVR